MVVKGKPKYWKVAQMKHEHPLIDEYIRLATAVRQHSERVLTPTGKKSSKPSYVAVTWCEYEQEPGITTSSVTKGRRWACKTCWNFTEPVWTDNDDKCQSADEALHEYVEWSDKQKAGMRAWTKGMMGNDIKG